MKLSSTTITLFSLAAAFASVVHGETAADCVADGGYHFCRAQGCVQPWATTTDESCCSELAGYSWRLGCSEGTSCCSPVSTPAPSEEACVVDGGFQWCEDQGCVQPWANTTSEACCQELPGFDWLLGCPEGSSCCAHGSVGEAASSNAGSVPEDTTDTEAPKEGTEAPKDTASAGHQHGAAMALGVAALAGLVL